MPAHRDGSTGSRRRHWAMPLRSAAWVWHKRPIAALARQGKRHISVADGRAGGVAQENQRFGAILMALTLPELPYAYDALGPYMSRETLEFHHDKHHQAYITNANKLMEGKGLEVLDL